MCEQKIVGKKSSKKSAKQRFLYLDEYRDKKWEAGNNARNNFYRRTRIVPEKILRKNLSKKVPKNVFYIHTNIMPKNWAEKTREIIFPETHELCDQKSWEKNRRKKCQNTFFIFRRIS